MNRICFFLCVDKRQYESDVFLWDGEEEDVDRRIGGRQHQRVDRAGVRQFPEDCGEQERVERAGCKVVSGVQTIRTGYGKLKWSEEDLYARTWSHNHALLTLHDARECAWNYYSPTRFKPIFRHVCKVGENENTEEDEINVPITLSVFRDKRKTLIQLSFLFITNVSNTFHPPHFLRFPECNHATSDVRNTIPLCTGEEGGGGISRAENQCQKATTNNSTYITGNEHSIVNAVWVHDP